jgi:hypothetical protein
MRISPATCFDVREIEAAIEHDPVRIVKVRGEFSSGDDSRRHGNFI